VPATFITLAGTATVSCVALPPLLANADPLLPPASDSPANRTFIDVDVGLKVRPLIVRVAMPPTEAEAGLRGGVRLMAFTGKVIEGVVWPAHESNTVIEGLPDPAMRLAGMVAISCVLLEKAVLMPVWTAPFH